MLWLDPKSIAVNPRAKTIDRNPSSILSGLPGPKWRWHLRFHLVSAFVLIWFGGVVALAGAERFFDFRQAKVNEPPPGFRSTAGSGGKPGEWKILLDDTSGLMPPISDKPVGKRPVLAQISRDRTDEHFPLLIWEDEILGDFSLSTAFKIVAGDEEQMAGIAFRIQDENNYYYIRASALGSTFNFFKIVEGVRSAPIGVKAEITKGVWHEMTVQCKGDQIRGWLDGKELIPALGDKSFNEGKVGFWTKSDSVSYFTDVKITYTPKVTLAQVLVRDALQTYPRLLGLNIFAGTTNRAEPRIIASTEAKELGAPAHQQEQDVIAHSSIYHVNANGKVVLIMPLHDANGESVAAVTVTMKSFPGQTEKNAIARALPIIKQMEARVRSVNDLTQ